MINAFEKPRLLDGAGRRETIKSFENAMEKSDTVFMRDGDGVFTMRHNGISVQIIPDFEHGTFRLDADTGVTINEGRETATYAFAKFKQEFVYKVAGFWAVKPDGNVAWTAGATIHSGYDRAIGDEDPGAAGKRVASTVSGIVSNLAAVNDGDDDLGKRAANKDGLLDLLLHFSGE